MPLIADAADYGRIAVATENNVVRLMEENKSKALQAALGQHGLRLHQQDLGGKAGRTVQLEPATGRLLIKSVSSVSVL